MSRSLLVAVAAVLVLVAGCANDESPTSPDAGYSPRGLVLQLNGNDVVVIDSTGAITGALNVNEGAMLDLAVLFLLADGTRGVPTTADHSLIASVASGRATVLTVPWRVTVSGVDSGQTTMTVALSKGGTTIYTSPAIPITIIHTPTSLEKGDTLVYGFRDRDTNDAPTGSTMKREWHVMQTGIAAYGRDNVTEIVELQYDASGTSVLARDTIYYSVAPDGSVYQYNLLHDLLARIDQGEAFVTQVPEQWVKITDTQAPSGTTWSAITPDSITITDLAIPGVPVNVDVVFRMSATHDGARSVVTPAGTFNGVRTTHRLQVKLRLAGPIPITILDDAVAATFDYIPVVGLLSQTLQGKNLVASLGGQEVAQAVRGFEMSLEVVRRR